MGFFFRSLQIKLFLALFFSIAYAQDSDLEKKVNDHINSKETHWGVELTFTSDAWTGSSLFTGSGVPVTNNYSLCLQWEYQVALGPSLGYLGFGPSLSTYPNAQALGLTDSFLNFFSVGAQLRYQGRWVPGQWIVPVAGYALDYLRYWWTSGVEGSLLKKGPFLGLMVLLNPLETTAAKELYISSSISRSYLVFEMRSTTLDNTTFSFAIKNLYVGLRFEY